MPSQSAYIIAARRTAIGRIGGLHRNRRIEELCAPLVGVALQDSGLEPGQVDELIVGNASQGGNPARLIALAAGLPETAPAATIDRQCGSGLDAILAAIRAVSFGDAQAIVAGGAEAISMAPWRVAKPRNLQQLPALPELRARLRRRPRGPRAYRIRRGPGQSLRHRPRRAGCLCLALAPQGRAGARAQALRRRDRPAARQPRRSARPELGGARLQGSWRNWRPTCRPTAR